MTHLAFDTDAFLHAQVAHTHSLPDGSSHNGTAMWWRRTVAIPGATWQLEMIDAPAGGPAVVDDFGDLVLAAVRS